PPMSSVASYRTPITALAPISFACAPSKIDSDFGSTGRFWMVRAHHQVVRLLAGLLAELGEQRDVPADDGLQRTAEGADDAARSHGDAADQAQVARDPIALEVEPGRDEVVRQRRHVCSSVQGDAVVSRPMKIVARPRKDSRPMPQVTVVRKIEDACAGS